MTEIADYLYSIFWSIMPISELRGGIPYAIIHGIHPVMAYLICCGANILAFPIVYFFLLTLHPLFMKWTFYETLFNKFIARTRKKLENNVEKYGFWALMIFVMIPLPVTGAYTGSFAAWVFGIPKRQAFLAVALGVLIAGVIVTAIMVTGAESFKFLVKDHV